MIPLERGGGYAPVAVTRRSGYDESVHLGAAVALAPDGSVVWSAGDPTVGIYPRSSCKPLQATAMVELGLDVAPELLALVCASHDGSPAHLDGVRRILAGAGLDESALQNTADLPYDGPSADDVVRAGGGAVPLQMNCSGKHAGMLATCVRNGWSTHDYLSPEHPLQQHLTDRIAELTGGVAHVGVDGCGAPAHVTSLRGLAGAFATIARQRAAVWTAMTTVPEMVGGQRRFVTRLMRTVPALMAKDGAEAVFAAALPDGRAIAVKIADGGQRAVPAVVLAALASVGVDVGEAGGGFVEPVLGHGRPVGEVRAVVGP